VSLQELSLALPTWFAEACGYRGEARYVAICWIPEDGQLWWSDDGHAYAGRPDALLALSRDPTTRPALAPFELAILTHGVRPWLLVDREERRLSFGSAAEVWAALEGETFEHC
jgi:hypothetical protein